MSKQKFDLHYFYMEMCVCNSDGNRSFVFLGKGLLFYADYVIFQSSTDASDL
jgi:hypothetical protein